MSIHIVRRSTRSTRSTPEPTATVSVDELAEELLEQLAVIRERLRSVYDPTIAEEQWTYVEIEEEIPRSLWLAEFHSAVAEDYGGDLEDFTDRLEFDYGQTRTLVLSIEKNSHGVVRACLIDPGYDDPIYLASADIDEFFDEARWREVALRWLLREMDANPRETRVILRRTPPRGRD